ncbi:MAG TPA: STAS domain-containing protein [Solirubrobacteraceae bacterium]|jgi:anti-sigma B factor antagonist/stage II sporulation protein AA (anti-sigma F factor antagonist)|nr:STAS domain-containing protein [Solirubrobacteraceae bacterium]
MATGFTVAYSRTGTGVRVLVSGDLDIFTGPILRHRLADLNEDSMVLDLTGVTFIDSSGLRALLDVFEAAGRRLSVIPGPTNARFFEMSGLQGKLSLE